MADKIFVLSGTGQDLMSKYFEKLVTNTMEGMTVDGLDKLEKNRSYLFISNHRDIVLDSACLNYFLRQSGHQTARVAVGDNLFSWPYAADLMRVNKSFIVKRGAPLQGSGIDKWSRLASLCGVQLIRAILFGSLKKKADQRMVTIERIQQF